MTDIKEIKEQLEKITQGIWESIVDADTGDELILATQSAANDKLKGKVIAYCKDNPYDQVFIASAPENIRYLLGEVERLEKELSNTITVANFNIDRAINAQNTTDKNIAYRVAIEQENAKLKEELELLRKIASAYETNIEFRGTGAAVQLALKTYHEWKERQK